MAGTLSNQGIWTGMDDPERLLPAGIIVRTFTNQAESFPFANSEDPASYRGRIFNLRNYSGVFRKLCPALSAPAPEAFFRCFPAGIKKDGDSF